LRSALQILWAMKMWIDVRFVRDGQVASSRCATANRAMEALGDLGLTDVFYAVDITGSVLMREQIAARAGVEAEKAQSRPAN
jgi:hypothetical protein